MATHDSKQTKQWEAVGHGPLKANESRGRVRTSYFQFKASRDAVAAVIAQNDSVRLCHIPAGARLLFGEVVHGAFGALTTLDLGLRGADLSGYLSEDGSTLADDPDGIATNLDVAAAGKKDMFEETGFIGYETEKEVELMALFEGANPADDVELSGYIAYVEIGRAHV